MLILRFPPKDYQVFDILVDIILFMFCFILHYVPWMFQRFYPLKKFLFFIQFREKIIIFPCSQAKAYITFNTEFKLSLY